MKQSPIKPHAGRFILHLQQMEAGILPVGIVEAEGRLQLKVGVPYQLTVPEALPPSELDLVIRKQVMGKNQDLLC